MATEDEAPMGVFEAPWYRPWWKWVLVGIYTAVQLVSPMAPRTAEGILGMLVAAVFFVLAGTIGVRFVRLVVWRVRASPTAESGES